jgi:thiol-disulfide isomerase/thioredoxin/tetratricopeptide (TPR) repeat protein
MKPPLLTGSMLPEIEQKGNTMNLRNKLLTALPALALTAGLSTATASTLNVGDPAPKLQTGKWMQGDPVTEFSPGKAYLVEFWATWCGPCRVSIPHLNEIHKQYKDKGLVVIGQDCWENDENLVAPFIKTMGEKMTYRVALDDKDGTDKGKMAATWMDAAGRNGIPSAFLVDPTGHIAWIGHPMELTDKLIEDVLAGKLDVHKAAEQYAQRTKNEAQMRTLYGELYRLRAKKQWDDAMAKVDEIEKLTPDESRPGLGLTRFQILIEKKDYPAAYKVAQQTSDALPNNASTQNELAWQMATDPAIENRDLALAEKIALRANDAAKGNDGSILDTVACVLFLEGKQEQAITFQEKAVALAVGNQKEELETTLECYKKGTNKPQVLRRQAQWLRGQGKLAEAEAALREELALERNFWENDSAKWNGTMNVLVGVLNDEHKYADSDQLLTEMLGGSSLSEAQRKILTYRAINRAQSGRFQDAADDLGRVIASDPTDHYNWFMRAPLLVQSGQLAEYRNHCKAALERFGATTNELIADRIAKICLEAPSAVDSDGLALAGDMAERAITLGKDSRWFYWFQFNKGLAKYRQGHFASAIEWADLAQKKAAQVRTGDQDICEAEACFVSAMAHYQLRQADEGRAAFARGRQIVQTSLPKLDGGDLGVAWYDVLMAYILMRETGDLINGAAETAQETKRGN